LVRVVERFEVGAREEGGVPRPSTSMPTVAYFSPEFGVSAGIPQYSGGLGVLAGDYLRVCADEGRPLIGVGLFYRFGYFHQHLNGDGWQEESYRELSPEELGLQQVAPTPIELPMAERTMRAVVWRQAVGSVPLYLLDSAATDNPPDLLPVTDRLYGGDLEHRLRQEILLGMGGIRALALAGESPALFHSNEGHAGFLALERIRHLVAGHGLQFDEAVEAARAATVFTTHTPVPAGIDRFPVELMARYFQGYCEEMGIGLDTLMRLGHFPGEPTEAPFNMAVLGLRMSGHANAVSHLHRRVSQRMFHGLWPDLAESEVPIQAVTNGVHPKHWVSPEMAGLLEHRLGPSWDVAGAANWDLLAAVDPRDLWQVRQPGRHRLVEDARRRVRAAELMRGAVDVDWTAHILDEGALTIGFARRVAEYKRGALLFHQPERLKRLLLDSKRPVQLLIAGKAHPRDEQGKHIIQALSRVAEDPELRGHLIFIEDYDIDVGRLLYQGADVWLNTPRRPMEACGTSGQKAALNGALNCSILDGWWDECYEDGNGFALPSFEEVGDLVERDRLEAEALFQVLENQVVPAFYDRGADGVPRRWAEMIRRSLQTIAPVVLGSRMLADYVRVLYQPAAAAAALAGADGDLGASQAVVFAKRVRESWPRVSARARSIPPRGMARGIESGSERLVEARVELDGLSPHEVEVHLLHGPIASDGQLVAPRTETMEVDESISSGPRRYVGRMSLTHVGPYGFTVRVMPRRLNRDAPPPELPVTFAAPLRLLP